MSTGAAVLAAGAGSRFTDGPKLLASVRGTPLVRLAVDHAVEAGVGPVAVITGGVDLVAAIEGSGAEVVHNPEWRHGMATSLTAALRWATARDLEAVLVGLGDQPGVLPEAWRAVAAVDDEQIAVATYAGRRGHPVRLPRSTWRLLPSTGDIGARELLGRFPARITEVACTGSSDDVDTVEDLRRWS